MHNKKKVKKNFSKTYFSLQKKNQKSIFSSKDLSYRFSNSSFFYKYKKKAETYNVSANYNFNLDNLHYLFMHIF